MSDSLKTTLIQAGRDRLGSSGAVNPPVNRTSTVLFETLEDYIAAEKGQAIYPSSDGITCADLSYGISGTQTNFALIRAIAELEGADEALLFPSGLNAITTTLLALLSPGDELLVVDSVYGPTRRFCTKELKKFGITTRYYHPLEPIEKHLSDNTRVILTESPGSGTFEVQNISALTAIAQQREIITIMDNSWATPLCFAPLKHGIDISLMAGTKYISGHSDVLLGTVACSSALAQKIFATYKNLGVHVSPDDCYLALRGLRTLAVRLKAHEEGALALANAINDHPRVRTLLHPAFESCPGHENFTRDFSGGTGLFSVELDRRYSTEELAKMINPMRHFGIGCSWGGFESLVLTVAAVRTAGAHCYEGSLVRFYVGLEDINDLIPDVIDALDRLPKA